jgi:hypothetical protein
MVVDVLGAERAAPLEHRPQQPVRPGQRAHGGDQAIVHARDQEAAKPALAVRYAQGREARPRQLPRALHEPLQDLIDRELGRDREDRIAHRPQRWTQPLIHARYVIHSMPRFWIYTMYATVFFTLVGMVIAITKLA